VTARPEDGPPDRQPYGNPTGRTQDELQACLPEVERTRRHGEHGYSVGDDTRGVVNEALSFKDRDYTPRYAETLGDGGRGYGVRGGDYSPEGESRCPRQSYSPVGHHCYHAGGHQHEADGQERDRTQVRLKVPPGGKERRDVEQRRQEEQEHHLRLELNSRKSRYEAEDQPAQDQQDRVRNPDPVGEGCERGHRYQQYEDSLYLRQGRYLLSPECRGTS
jgi:hypothetical protein